MTIKIAAWPAYQHKHLNPYTALLYEEMETLGDVHISEFSTKQALVKHYDILHIHWPESILKETSLAIAWVYFFKLILVFSWMKLRGTKIIWTIHNTKSHDQRFPRLEKLYFSWFVRQVNGTITLSDRSLQVAQSVYPQLSASRNRTIPHGHYRSIYPNGISQAAARDLLGLDPQKKTVLFFGNIKRYKSVPRLIQSFQGCDSHQSQLLIAGLPDAADLRQEILGLAARSPQIKLVLAFIETERVQQFMNAADLVILPYQHILNSGSALLALSFNKPVVLPNQGSLRELQAQVGTDWIYTYDGDMNAQVLEMAWQWNQHHQSNRAAIAPLQAFDWAHIAQSTRDFYQSHRAPANAAGQPQPGPKPLKPWGPTS